MHNRILILDYGSQFTQLIARRVREERVYCEIHPPAVTTEFWNVTKKPTSLIPFQTKFVPPIAAKPIEDHESATHGQV